MHTLALLLRCRDGCWTKIFFAAAAFEKTSLLGVTHANRARAEVSSLHVVVVMLSALSFSDKYRTVVATLNVTLDAVLRDLFAVIQVCC